MVYADTEWNHRIIFKHKLHYDNLLVQKNWYIFQVSSFIEKMNMNECFSISFCHKINKWLIPNNPDAYFIFYLIEFSMITTILLYSSNIISNFRKQILQ